VRRGDQYSRPVRRGNTTLVLDPALYFASQGECGESAPNAAAERERADEVGMNRSMRMQTDEKALQDAGIRRWRAEALLACSDVLAIDSTALRGRAVTGMCNRGLLQAAVRAAQERRGTCAQPNIVS